MMQQTMRWYGPSDAVSLSDIRQAGCSGVVTALHHIPVGDVWSIAEINKRKKLIEDAGMTWTVIESLPVHEDIKKRAANYQQYISNYKVSLQNVGQCGIKVVTYNFMPVLDWVRTDVSYELPSGSKALYFHRSAFVAFDLFLLKRPHAMRDYSETEVLKAKEYFSKLSTEQRTKLFRNCLLGLPGSDEAFTPEQVLQALSEYRQTDATALRNNLAAFLKDVVPSAENAGVKLAIHPDDPPYPILGLPRVVSTESDLQNILEAYPSDANGLCFCTGSLGARPDNDIIGMIRRFGYRINFLHLRNTTRDAEGNFIEAEHLSGDTDMYAVVKEIVSLMKEQRRSIPMRPDHGHQMLDDLNKKTYPGYSAIGRLKGLAELRGLELAIVRGFEDVNNR